ncbi:cell division cycle- protein [Mortierella sp. NVP41]|nr:cell division cycle- protein [Mortierella sp. NVP41]
MPGSKISDTYTSIIKHPSTERPRPSSDMGIKQAAQAPLQTEALETSQHTATSDIKRLQGHSFETRKKAKMLLGPGHGKSVNHFSQSARVLQSRPQSNPFEQPSTRTTLTKPTLDRPLSRYSAFKISPEAMTLAGKSRSTPSSSSSVSSKTSALPAPPAGPSLATESTSGTAKTSTRATTTSRTIEHTRLSSHKSDLGSTSLLPQPARSMTFSGSVSVSGGRGLRQPFSESPFSGSNSTSHGQLAKTPSSKSAHSAAKRLGRTQSLLKQTTLVTPFMAKLETHLLPPIKQSSVLSEETPWMQRSRTKKEDNLQNDTEPSGQEHDADDDGRDDDRVDDETVEGLQVGSSIGQALDSCTAAMTALSPPSAKKSTKALISSSLRMSYQPSFTTLAPESTSLSLLSTGSAAVSLSLSDDDNHDQASDKSPSGQDKVARPPHASHKSHSSSSISSTTKRPILWRRHQTMISSRGEFMKTLESNSGISKKPLVFASDNYVPDPLREECQILPPTTFITKPDDTTRRVSPKTVVDVLEGKYKDKYDILHIIDCRFPYEFEGGHIKSAVNINTTGELDKLLLQPARTDKRVLLIFHCEFSSKRAPRLARHLRNQDRAWNVSHYPALFYPEVYVMEGGYSSFFEENKSYCWPEAYVKM